LGVGVAHRPSQVPTLSRVAEYSPPRGKADPPSHDGGIRLPYMTLTSLRARTCTPLLSPAGRARAVGTVQRDVPVLGNDLAGPTCLARGTGPRRGAAGPEKSGPNAQGANLYFINLRDVTYTNSLLSETTLALTCSTTASGGSLGSQVDEERSKLRKSA
jgi:hypothetical protein